MGRHEYWKNTTKPTTCFNAKGEHSRVVTRLDGCWDSPLRAFLSKDSLEWPQAGYIQISVIPFGNYLSWNGPPSPEISEQLASNDWLMGEGDKDATLFTPLFIVFKEHQASSAQVSTEVALHLDISICLVQFLSLLSFSSPPLLVPPTCHARACTYKPP